MIPTSLMKECTSTILFLKYFIFFKTTYPTWGFTYDEKWQKVKARLEAKHKHWSEVYSDSVVT